MQIERLRIDQIILGYRSKSGKYYYYSKDLYAWSGQQIKFKQTDLFSGYKDKNNKHLFERDIILYNGEYFEMVYDKPLDKFYLLNLSTHEITEINEVLKTKNFLFYSYIFIQKA